MRDNVALMALQTALNKANPQGLPSNYVIQQFGAPNDTVPVPDSVTATITPTSAMLYGGLVTYYDWATATLTQTDATTHAPSLILAKTGGTYYASGTAQTPSVDLSAAAAVPDASLTVYWGECLPVAAVSVSVQVRFSADDVTWGAWQTAAQGQTLTSIERYCEVLATLTTTDTTQTPQMNALSLAVVTPAKWDMAQYTRSGETAFVLPAQPTYY